MQLLHQPTFTPTNFYTKQLLLQLTFTRDPLHQTTFTPDPFLTRTFYTNQNLHPPAKLCTRQLLLQLTLTLSFLCGATCNNGTWYRSKMLAYFVGQPVISRHDIDQRCLLTFLGDTWSRRIMYMLTLLGDTMRLLREPTCTPNSFYSNWLLH